MLPTKGSQAATFFDLMPAQKKSSALGPRLPTRHFPLKLRRSFDASSMERVGLNDQPSGPFASVRLPASKHGSRRSSTLTPLDGVPVQCGCVLLTGVSLRARPSRLLLYERSTLQTACIKTSNPFGGDAITWIRPGMPMATNAYCLALRAYGGARQKFGQMP